MFRLSMVVWTMSCLMVMSLLTGCGGGGGRDEGSGESEQATNVQRYDVRGIVRQLPGPGGQELMIRHEAIPDFVNSSGEAVGMDAMTMGFPVADEVDLSAFAPGDSVGFVFEVRWDGSPPLRLTSMEELPPGTELEFGKVGQ